MVNKQMTIIKRLKRSHIIILVLLFSLFLLFIFLNPILSGFGHLLIVDDKPIHSDVAVVLTTGIDYYPRLIEAADLYRKGYTKKIAINGNRSTDILKDLKKKGYEECCSWYENSFRILSLHNVPRDKIIAVSAEDAYDTITEANIVGRELLRQHTKSIIITTSKFHTRRAKFIWENLFGDQFTIIAISAKTDPYDPDGWWKHGRQIRWVLAEFGAWMYYWWKYLINE